MSDTKERILQVSLRLFAKEGYEAVSVSTIAGELGMTKGALYKHYTNKRAIFDCIVERMYQIDAGNAKECEVPEKTFAEESMPYRHTAMHKIQEFIEIQFRFWTEDEFACNFRKMLTLEQYRNPEMAELYQKILASGPVSYMEDLFREMIEQGKMQKNNPRQLALEFYAPFYLLLSISDAAANAAEKEQAAKLLTAHVERFIAGYAAGKLSEK